MPTTTEPSGTSTAGLYDHDLLRSWRKQAGLTRERVGADVGLSASWLGIIEQGAPGRGASMGLLIKLARYYGHELPELLLQAA